MKTYYLALQKTFDPYNRCYQDSDTGIWINLWELYLRNHNRVKLIFI